MKTITITWEQNDFNQWIPIIKTTKTKQYVRII